MKWRRYKDSDVWHYNENCPEWPTSDYVESNKEPRDGYICDMCEDYDGIDEDFGFEEEEWQ